jgi:hypothetical protein
MLRPRLLATNARRTRWRVCLSFSSLQSWPACS